MRILSLFWHSVEPDSIDLEHFNGSSPTQSMFRQQIKFIANNFTPISIFDFMKITEDKSLIKSYAKPPVLLGFDDGFKNVISYALPVLNEFNIPALFFVIGEILKNPDYVPWYVEIMHLLRKTKKSSVVYDNSEFNPGSTHGLATLKCHFNTSFKENKSEKDRQSFLDNIFDLLDVKRPVASDLDEDMRFVNKDDLSNLGSTSLLTVSSHAMTHRCLAALSYKEQIYELEQSDMLLRRFCPSYYPTIAYPDGSFNQDTINIAKKIYRFAFAVLLGASYGNIFAYPRICIQNDTVKTLAYAVNPMRINILLPIKRFLHNFGIRKIVY